MKKRGSPEPTSSVHFAANQQVLIDGRIVGTVIKAPAPGKSDYRVSVPGKTNLETISSERLGAQEKTELWFPDRLTRWVLDCLGRSFEVESNPNTRVLRIDEEDGKIERRWRVKNEMGWNANRLAADQEHASIRSQVYAALKDGKLKKSDADNGNILYGPYFTEEEGKAWANVHFDLRQNIQVSEPAATVPSRSHQNRANWLRAQMKTRKLITKHDLARESDLEHRTIQKMLDGLKVAPSTIEKLAGYFDIDSGLIPPD